ncbi:hypothetical protein NQ318_016692, partial [Aromia moschata]
QPMSATEVCKSGLEIFPRDVAIMTELARLSETMNDTSTSVKQYRNIVVEDATNTEAIACIGMYHFYNHQPELALRYYRQCLAAKLVPKLVTDRPTEERPATQHDDSSASTMICLSEEVDAQRLEQEMETETIEVDNFILVKICSKKSEILLCPLPRRVLAMGAHTAELYNNLGLCCLYAQQLDLTLPCFQRALDLATDPDTKADVWYNLAYVAIHTVLKLTKEPSCSD